MAAKAQPGAPPAGGLQSGAAPALRVPPPPPPGGPHPGLAACPGTRRLYAAGYVASYALYHVVQPLPCSIEPACGSLEFICMVLMARCVTHRQVSSFIAL